MNKEEFLGEKCVEGRAGGHWTSNDQKMATGLLQQKLLNIFETVPIVFTLFFAGSIGYHNGR